MDFRIKFYIDQEKQRKAEFEKRVAEGEDVNNVDCDCADKVGVKTSASFSHSFVRLFFNSFIHLFIFIHYDLYSLLSLIFLLLHLSDTSI